MNDKQQTNSNYIEFNVKTNENYLSICGLVQNNPKLSIDSEPYSGLFPEYIEIYTNDLSYIEPQTRIELQQFATEI